MFHGLIGRAASFKSIWRQNCFVQNRRDMIVIFFNPIFLQFGLINPYLTFFTVFPLAFHHSFDFQTQLWAPEVMEPPITTPGRAMPAQPVMAAPQTPGRCGSSGAIGSYPQQRGRRQILDSFAMKGLGFKTTGWRVGLWFLPPKKGWFDGLWESKWRAGHILGLWGHDRRNIRPTAETFPWYKMKGNTGRDSKPRWGTGQQGVKSPISGTQNSKF